MTVGTNTLKLEKLDSSGSAFSSCGAGEPIQFRWLQVQNLMAGAPSPLSRIPGVAPISSDGGGKICPLYRLISQFGKCHRTVPVVHESNLLPSNLNLNMSAVL